MIRKSSHESINTQIADEAAEWFVEFSAGEPEADARQAFDAWLRKSPEHLRAYLELFSIWDDAARVDPHKNVDSAELIELARAADSNVVPMPIASPVRPASATPAIAGEREDAPDANSASQSYRDYSFSRSGWAALAASIVVAVLAFGGWHYSQRGLHATGIGEQRTITLPDGSHIELNARSKVRLKYQDDERRIELLAGQALFNVAKDPNRPFIVASGETQIRAVGTMFDVYRKRGGTTVTVIEGRVAVHAQQAETVPQPTAMEVPRAASSESAGITSGAELTVAGILLGAGEQLMVTPTVVEKDRADVAAATAWRQRQLIFSSTPLTEVAEEFNRYNTRQLVVMSPSLASFNVSAVFSATDLTSLLRFLRAQSNIHIEESDDEIRISSPQSHHRG